jgi:multidrug resistance protein MdtO
LIVTLFLAFRVPLASYGAYLVLLASQRDVASSVTASVGSLAAGAFALAFSLLLYIVDVGEPALRVPVMAIVTFGAMYLSRLPKVGPLLFLAGFLVVITQTLVDQVPDTETLTHLILWLLLIIGSACTLVPLIESIFGQRSRTLFDAGLRERMQTIQALFGSRQAPMATHPVTELAMLASRLGPGDSHTLALIVELEQLGRLKANRYPEQSWHGLSRAVELFERGQVSVPGRDLSAPVGLSADETLIHEEAVRLVSALCAPPPTLPASQPTRAAPDPNSHIQGLRFAFKATVAAMGCYILYSGLDWTGIRTSVITCFFVALGSTGETVHRLSLRLTGALMGGILAGISIVFVFPLLDDIGGFIVLFVAVTFLCTWVATSSPLLAYAGLQMAFAFYLGVLQDAGPTDDLTVLRDRLVGIVLGNVAMSVVFLVLWPVRTVDSMRQVLARIARRLSRGTGSPSEVLANAADLEDARRLSVVASFDVSTHPSGHRSLGSSLRAMEEVMAWAGAVCGRTSGEQAVLPAPLAARLISLADTYQGHVHSTSSAASAISPPLPAPLENAFDVLDEEASGAI